jgi:hypothetical protein
LLGLKRVRLHLGKPGNSKIVKPNELSKEADIDELADGKFSPCRLEVGAPLAKRHGLLDNDILLPVDIEDEDQPKVEPLNIAFSIQKDGIVSRPITIPLNIDFELFRYHVANKFGEAANSQELVWKTNRMAKTANWGALKDVKDFERIMEQAVATLCEENDCHSLIIAKNAAGADKAKQRGKPFVHKPVPTVEEYIITICDCNQEQKSKACAPKKVLFLLCNQTTVKTMADCSNLIGKEY